MTIENTLRTAKIRMAYLIILTLAAVLTAYYFIEYNRQYAKNLIIIIISLLVSTYFFMLILKLNYFGINMVGNKMTIKYYTAHPLFRNYKFIEIPKVAFHDYSIEKSFLGLKKEIKIVAKTKDKTFNFTPISISALHKKKIEELEYIMNQLKQNNLKLYN